MQGSVEGSYRFLDLWCSVSDEELLCKIVQNTDSIVPEGVALGIMEKFGSLKGALAASPRRLQQVDGINSETVRLLKIIGKIWLGMAKRRIELVGPRIRTAGDLDDYLQSAVWNESGGETRVLFLNKSRRLIADEVVRSDVTMRMLFSPAQVVRRALELSASSLILIQKTKGQVTHPSEREIRLTKRLEAIAHSLDIYLDERVDGNGSGQLSYRALGLVGRGKELLIQRSPASAPVSQ